MSYLQRNDPETAVKVYKHGLLSGTWTPTDSRRILSMQDDPGELLKLIADANKDAEVAAALERMLAKDQGAERARR